MFIQVLTDLNCTQVHIISHKSTVGSKKKMVAGKSYYRYLGCFLRMIYVFIAFSPYWNKKLDCRKMKTEVRINLLQDNVLIKSELLICLPISCRKASFFWIAFTVPLLELLNFVLLYLGNIRKKYFILQFVFSKCSKLKQMFKI